MEGRQDTRLQVEGERVDLKGRSERASLRRIKHREEASEASVYFFASLHQKMHTHTPASCLHSGRLCVCDAADAHREDAKFKTIKAPLSFLFASQ